MTKPVSLSLEQFQQAQASLRPYLPKTPLAFSEPLSRRIGKRVWFKLETQQPTHSFKVRPAFVNLLMHRQQAQERGVVTSSSGNFAQAVAYAAHQLGIDAHIVMMERTSPYKVQKTNDWGATTVFCENTYESRWNTTYDLQRKTQRYLLHPYDSIETIAGDGTIGLELLEEFPGKFTVLVPVSGGGLVSGIANVIKLQRPECQVVGVQPKNNGAMALSWTQGKRIRVPEVSTIADALTAPYPGELTLSLAHKFVDEIRLVSEESIREAFCWVFQQQKLIIEPGGCTGPAALLSQESEMFHDDIVCIASGGNVQHQTLLQLLENDNRGRGS